MSSTILSCVKNEVSQVLKEVVCMRELTVSRMCLVATLIWMPLFYNLIKFTLKGFENHWKIVLKVEVLLLVWVKFVGKCTSSPFKKIGQSMQLR